MITILLSMMLGTFLDLQYVDAFIPNCDGWPTEHRADKATKVSYRKRSWDTCKAMGADDETCNVVDAIAIRESYGGDACAVHTLGPKEYGLGMHGLSVGLHLTKWEDPRLHESNRLAGLLHIPEVSTVVTLRIFRRAVTRYRAKRWRDVGNVFGGRFEFDKGDEATGDDVIFCSRLKKAGVDCNADPRGKLGKKLGRDPSKDQEQFVLDLLRSPTHGR